MLPKSKKTISLNSLSCPNCGTEIAIGELMSHQVAERVREEMRAEVVSLQEDITARERRLRNDKEQNETAIADRVRLATEEARKKIADQATLAVQATVDSLREEVGNKAKLLEQARATEVSLRRQTATLEERAQGLDLEVARKVDDERKKIAEQVAERLATEHRFEVAARDKQLSDAMDVIASLKAKMEQGSQQLQGEVLELEIEKMLAVAFPLDLIEPVPKGVNGADVVHRVVSRSGTACGSIIWELKRTKNFNDDWLAKLRADQRVAKSEIAVLVSTALPSDIRSFTQIDGVWVCSVDHAEALAHALRSQLLAVSASVAVNSGKKEKMELVYDYIAGQGFRQRVEAIVEAFTEMQSDIEEERRVSERRWSKRAKQVATVIGSTAGMYGDFQGLIGITTMPAVPQLEDKR